MSSLVADYGSESEITDDGDEEKNNQAITVAQELREERDVKGRNLLVTTDDSSDDDQEYEDENGDLSHHQTHGQTRLPNPLVDKLPSPDIYSASDPEDLATAFSVFTNRYHEAERAKHSILEKHVKMTENLQAGKGPKKQICWKFRKGKCRFGKSCKYSHDLDTISDPNQTNTFNMGEQHDTKSAVGSGQSIQRRAPPVCFASHIERWQEENGREELDDDSYMANAKRKRRAGINDSLCPSKKALGPLHSQRAKERPWTVNDKD